MIILYKVILYTPAWRWHSQGMGKYFVTLAKQVGYEQTILLLGRHLRFQSIGIRMLTFILTKAIAIFFLDDRSNHYNTSPASFITNVPPRDFFLNLDNLHDYLKYTFPKVRPKRPKRKDKKGQFLFYKNIIFCRWKPLPSSLKQRTKIKWCFNTGTTWSNPIYGRGDFGEHVLNTLL